MHELSEPVLVRVPCAVQGVEVGKVEAQCGFRAQVVLTVLEGRFDDSHGFREVGLDLPAEGVAHWGLPGGCGGLNWPLV